MLKDQDGHVGAEMILYSQSPLLNVTLSGHRNLPVSIMRKKDLDGRYQG